MDRVTLCPNLPGKVTVYACGIDLIINSFTFQSQRCPSLDKHTELINNKQLLNLINKFDQFDTLIKPIKSSNQEFYPEVNEIHMMLKAWEETD